MVKRFASIIVNASINVKPEDGRGGAYVGHLTFQKRGSEIWSNQIKYPHLGKGISLKFIVFSVNIVNIF